MIRTENLTREYVMGSEKVIALNDCSIEIGKGELVAVTGNSGSGKTTLLQLLGGLDEPTSGNVFIDGVNIYSMNSTQRTVFRRSNIGFVFQSYNLIPELTSLDNIVLPYLIDKKKPDKKYIETIVNELDLQERLSHYPSQLSGGQQQRVAIARALVQNPKVLLCDEPTGNLDSQTAENVIELLCSIAKSRSITLVIVTHDSGVSNKMNRIINISDGKVQG